MSDALERIKDAREALDAMDDLARMDCSVNPIGPRRVLEGLIAEHEALLRRVADAPVAVAGAAPGRFYYAGADTIEHGQRVRILAEPGEVGS